MLSYQHGYHAGNFADVIKHFTLTRLLNYLTQKEKPLFYLETHSGRGIYDLKDKQALKTGEFQQGIQQIWKSRAQLPELFTPYLQAIQTLNEADHLHFYPGSPYIALQMLRPEDRLYCCELHPEEFRHLKSMPSLGKRIHSSESDGVKQLTALLPPNERRGLIFIDPAYEVKTEYRQIPQVLKSAYQRFETGVYGLWYPLLADKKPHEQLLRGLNLIGDKSHLRMEFLFTRHSEVGMYGCGLWIINPPYTLEKELKQALPILCNILNPGGSSFLME